MSRCRRVRVDPDWLLCVDHDVMIHWPRRRTVAIAARTFAYGVVGLIIGALIGTVIKAVIA